MSQRIEGPTRTFTAGGALKANRRVRLSGGKLAYCGAADLDCLGNLQQEAFADGDVVAVRLVTAPGTDLYVASVAIDVGGTGYAAANGKIAATGTVPVCEAIEAATADLDVIEGVPNRGNPTAVARASLTQDNAAPYALPFSEFKVWDAPATNIVSATGANDDLALVYNTFLTGADTIETGDLKAAGATTRKVSFRHKLSPEYVAGQAITVRIKAGMKTTVAGVSATVDLEVARKAAPTVDICATAAQSINSLVGANKDFTLTPTDCVPGDILVGVISIAVNDAATGTAVIGQITDVSVLESIKG